MSQLQRLLPELVTEQIAMPAMLVRWSYAHSAHLCCDFLYNLRSPCDHAAKTRRWTVQPSNQGKSLQHNIQISTRCSCSDSDWRCTSWHQQNDAHTKAKSVHMIISMTKDMKTFMCGQQRSKVAPTYEKKPEMIKDKFC